MAQGRNPNLIEENDPALTQTRAVDRPAIRSSAAGAPPEVVDPYSGGVVSSLGLQTDTANSQLPGVAHPIYRLMPLSASGNPATNAAIQSTTNNIVTQVVTTLPPIKLNVVNASGGIVNTLGSGNGGTGLTDPGPALNVLTSTGVAWISAPVVNSLNAETGAVILESLDGTVVITTPTASTINLSAHSGINGCVEINAVGVAIDKQFYFNGVADVVAVWGVKINGTPDGG
jgi:hypothetical protein